MNEIMNIQNLTKSYDKTILEDVNLTILENEFVCIMGPSGSGKSTFINCISTIDSPTSGKVVLNGKDISQMKPKEVSKLRVNDIGFVFQAYYLIDTLSVYDNIAMTLISKKEKVKNISEKVNEIAKDFGLDKLLDKYPFQLSGGQQQRVSIARSFIKEPSIIIADEPTGALDRENTDHVLELISNYLKKSSNTVLLVTHDPYVASFASRVLFLGDKKIKKELVKDEYSDNEQYANDIIENLKAH